jgi:Bacteriophage head to tail connecting protein
MNLATSSVAQRYGQLEAERLTFLNRGRRAAELTIPTMLPKEGHTATSDFQTPYQAVGARGVNNLASKLLLALLPPNSPFFRLSIDEATLQAIAQNKRGAVEAGLAKIERTAMQEIETSALRVPVYEALRQLIVSGNALLYVPPVGGVRVFRLDRFVVKRDAMGNVLEIITKETVSPQMLPDTAKAMLGDPNDNGQRNIDLFTYCCRKEGMFHFYQEVNGQVIPTSVGEVPLDRNPFIPLRFTRIDGEDYGRGYVEEYFGDLASLEALSQAIVEGSAAAAKLLFLVRPNGTTKMRVLAEAPNGAFVQGNADDVSVLQLDKAADFRVAMETMRSINERLSFSFLLNSSVQRDAERVTAEEVRFMAQELESALGGVYSILSQELQLPMIKNILLRLEEQGKVPPMPKGTIKPQVITGLEALGRGQDLNKLATFLKFLQPLGPEVLAREMNIDDYIDRLGASLGIDTDGLIKSPEQKAQEAQAAAAAQQQQAMMQMAQEVIGKATPAISQGFVKQTVGE